MKTSSKVGIAVVVIAIIAIVAFVIGVTSVKPTTAGSVTTNLPSLGTADLAVGSGCDVFTGICTGTEVTRIVTGTCYLFQATTTTGSSIAASSTSMVDCQSVNPYSSNTAVATALTNIPAFAAGDRVFLTSATSTPFGVEFVGAISSTTAGFIQVAVQNQTGAAFTLATTSVKFQYLFVRAPSSI